MYLQTFVNRAPLQNVSVEVEGEKGWYEVRVYLLIGDNKTRLVEVEERIRGRRKAIEYMLDLCSIYEGDTENNVKRRIKTFQETVEIYLKKFNITND